MLNEQVKIQNVVHSTGTQETFKDISSSSTKNTILCNNVRNTVKKKGTQNESINTINPNTSNITECELVIKRRYI